MSKISMLKIDIDGHFHGSGDVPKPWVAEIVGPCPNYGLARKFLSPMTDWRDAHRACSGNIYGRTASFAMRDGRIYEISRCKGKSSKRHVVREFVAVVDGKRKKLSPQEALARIYRNDVLCEFVRDKSCGWVARVRGLGTPERLGFVVVGEHRIYLLESGLYEVANGEDRRFIVVDGQSVQQITEQGALAWLADA